MSVRDITRLDQLPPGNYMVRVGHVFPDGRMRMVVAEGEYKGASFIVNTGAVSRYNDTQTIQEEIKRLRERKGKS